VAHAGAPGEEGGRVVATFFQLPGGAGRALCPPLRA